MRSKTIPFKEGQSMNIDLLKNYFSKENWGKHDLRALKGELLKMCAGETEMLHAIGQKYLFG